MAAAAGDIAGPNLASAAFGLVTLVFGFGQIFGPLIAGRLVEATGAYALPFLLASAVAISGAFCAFLFIPNRLVE
jgi:MFS family permease